MKRLIPFHLWPNVLSIDAPLIALLWQSCLARICGHPLGFGAQAVLFLSVWLTYAADHLFDVRGRPEESLHSLRHIWTKRHAARLWTVWFGVLLLDIHLAFRALEPWQLQQGAWLLSACLLYTALNQWLSRCWFPKEASVAAIFAAGVLIFQPLAGQAPSFFLMASVFFLNCLAISLKERPADAALGHRTLSTAEAPNLRRMVALCLALQLILFPANPPLAMLTAFSIALLACQHWKHATLDAGTCHALADACLMPAPLLYCLFG